MFFVFSSSFSNYLLVVRVGGGFLDRPATVGCGA